MHKPKPPSNKLLKSSAVTGFVITTLVYMTYEWWQNGSVTSDVLFYLYVICTSYLVVMYIAEKKPGVTTVFVGFVSLVRDYALGRIQRQAMLQQLEWLIEQAVRLWDITNQCEKEKSGEKKEEKKEKGPKLTDVLGASDLGEDFLGSNP